MRYEEEIEQIAEKKAIQEKQKEMEARLVVAFKNIIDAPDGRKVLKTIMQMCPLELDCFSSDEKLMAYRCGRKSIVLELRDFVKVHFGNGSLNDIEKEEI